MKKTKHLSENIFLVSAAARSDFARRIFSRQDIENISS
jgi:hypothetical protein